MTKVESGEWEPVMKIAQTTTLGFSSIYWSNNELLNAGSPLAEEASTDLWLRRGNQEKHERPQQRATKMDGRNPFRTT